MEQMINNSSLSIAAGFIGLIQREIKNNIYPQSAKLFSHHCLSIAVGFSQRKKRADNVIGFSRIHIMWLKPKHVFYPLPLAKANGNGWLYPPQYKKLFSGVKKVCLYESGIGKN